MAIGLGMTPEEWSELRSKVDDSFWVMRVIGIHIASNQHICEFLILKASGYPPLPNDYDGFSCGAHKDYGCLT